MPQSFSADISGVSSQKILQTGYKCSKASAMGFQTLDVNKNGSIYRQQEGLKNSAEKVEKNFT